MPLPPLLGLAIGIAVAASAWLALRAVLRHAAKPRATRADLLPAPAGADVLVVLAHGLTGRAKFEGAVALVGQVLPAADRLVVDYDRSPITNLDPYAVADFIEQRVHDAVKTRGYRTVLLVGHSAGAALLRKAFVWGHGLEEDRDRFGRRGRRTWVDGVERFVLLAGINRGWSITPRPAHMTTRTYVAIRLGELVARLFGIGRLSMGLRRGAPFIADTRVQWIRLSRSDAVLAREQPFPQVVQLIGSEDDIVSKEDGQDLLAARGTIFKTLPQTGHREIGAALDDPASPGAAERVARIGQALLGQIEALEPDVIDLPPERREVTRVFYVMHGIRDYGEWTDLVRSEIERRSAQAGANAVVVNKKYGYFPLLPFITYRDRQRNVRRFMDEYTENLARFPNAETIDYVGHSNGTYILASALQRYATIRVRRVYFAGSVVPKHYPWEALIDAGRVQQVVNVVATADWVVAIFPKLFEQIADWQGRTPVTGWLDLGAAGFRGFLDSASPTGRVIDVKFSRGAHSTGVDIGDAAKLDAIARYAMDGDTEALRPFRAAASQAGWLGVLSNVSYLVWAGLAAAIVVLGWVAATSLGWIALAVYALLVLALLHSI